MKKYISNLLPRMKAFGKKLNKIEEFADKTWTLHDDSGNISTYRFKRKGTLRKSVNGDFYDMEWELEGDDAMAIRERGKSVGEIFRHGFILDGLLVVQKEGKSTTPTIFYNPEVVIDGDIESYLLSYIINKERLGKVEGAEKYYFKNGDDFELKVGQAVYDAHLQPVSADIVKTKNRIIHIENGAIKSIVFYKTFQSDKGELKIYSHNYAILHGTVLVGNKVESETGSTINGTFRLKGNSDAKIVVENSKIVKVKQPFPWLLAFFGFCLALTIVLVVFQSYSKSQSTPPINIYDTVIANIPSVDTPMAAADTTVGGFQLPDIYVVDAIKNSVSGYFNMINERRWSDATSIFESSVNVFGESSVSNLTLPKRLSDYWGVMSNSCGVIYDQNDFKITALSNSYDVSVDALEVVEQGIYKIPFVFTSTMYFSLNQNYKIISISSQIISKNIFFQRLFEFDLNIGMEDYKLRDRTDDWEKMFTKISRIASTTPSVYGYYKDAIVELYDKASKVQTASNTYYLGDFLDQLRYNKLVYSYTSQVVSNADGTKTIFVSLR